MWIHSDERKWKRERERRSEKVKEKEKALRAQINHHRRRLPFHNPIIIRIEVHPLYYHKKPIIHESACACKVSLSQWKVIVIIILCVCFIVRPLLYMACPYHHHRDQEPARSLVWQHTKLVLAQFSLRFVAPWLLCECEWKPFDSRQLNEANSQRTFLFHVLNGITPFDDEQLIDSVHRRSWILVLHEPSTSRSLVGIDCRSMSDETHHHHRYPSFFSLNHHHRSSWWAVKSPIFHPLPTRVTAMWHSRVTCQKMLIPPPPTICSAAVMHPVPKSTCLNYLHHPTRPFLTIHLPRHPHRQNHPPHPLTTINQARTRHHVAVNRVTRGLAHRHMWWSARPLLRHPAHRPAPHHRNRPVHRPLNEKPRTVNCDKDQQ